MSHQCDIKNGIHPRPCGMINLSNIISYGRGTLPNLIDMSSYFAEKTFLRISGGVQSNCRKSPNCFGSCVSKSHNRMDSLIAVRYSLISCPASDSRLFCDIFLYMFIAVTHPLSCSAWRYIFSICFISPSRRLL